MAKRMITIEDRDFIADFEAAGHLQAAIHMICTAERRLTESLRRRAMLVVESLGFIYEEFTNLSSKKACGIQDDDPKVDQNG